MTCPPAQKPFFFSFPFFSFFGHILIPTATYLSLSVRSGVSHIPRAPRTTKLTRGTHTFDFQFPVPPTAPCSFSGSHGNVRYTLKAVVERPWKVDVNTRSITVQSPLDLNDVPGARVSSREQMRERAFCV